MNIILHMENGNDVKIENVINRNVTTKEYQIINEEDYEEKVRTFKTEDIKFVTFA